MLVCWHLFAMISTIESQNLQTNEGQCLPFIVQEDHRVHCQGSGCKQFAKFGSVSTNHHSLTKSIVSP